MSRPRGGATHTFAELEVPAAVYDDIADRLRQAGYDHVFLEGGAMDMHGIALTRAANGCHHRVADPPMNAVARRFIEADWRAQVQVDDAGQPLAGAEMAAWISRWADAAGDRPFWVVAAPGEGEGRWDALCIVGNGENAGALASVLSASPRMMGITLEFERLARMRAAGRPEDEILAGVDRIVAGQLPSALERLRDGGAPSEG